jgi:hypothetical protein
MGLEYNVQLIMSGVLNCAQVAIRSNRLNNIYSRS